MIRTRIKSQEDALFAEWKGSGQSFIYDGLVDEESYLASDPKIIFVLKESYDNTTPGDAVVWDLREKILGVRAPTWSTVARWAYGLGVLKADADWETTRAAVANPAVYAMTMKSIGSMNIKKTPSRTAITDARKLTAYGEDTRNKGLLRRQWSLYQPAITVCGGKEPFRRMVAALDGAPKQYQTAKNGVRYWRAEEGQLLIEACHPAARHSAKSKYESVVNAAREALADSKTKTGA
jgi:hypothetical protein